MCDISLWYGSLNIFVPLYERATKAQQERFCLNVKSFHGNGKGMEWYFSLSPLVVINFDSQ